MTNVSLGVVVLLFAALGLGVMVQSIRKHHESDSSIWFVLLCLMNEFWALCYALYFLVPPAHAMFFFRCGYGFIMGSSICTYLFMFKMLKHRMYSRSVLTLMLGLPVLTVVLGATNPLHNLLFTNLALIDAVPVRTFASSAGIWYYLHCVVSYFFILWSVKLMVQQYRRMPQNYKLPVTIMMAALAFTGFSSLASVLKIIPTVFDATALIAIGSQCIFYYALYYSRSLDLLFTSRDFIFENLSYPVLLISDSNRILDYNEKAQSKGNDLLIHSLFDMKYETFLNCWMSDKNGRTFHEDDSIFTVLENGTDAHYQIQKNPMFNSHGRSIGLSVEIKNITPIMSLIHKLQDAAYFDNLTGLYNRGYFMNRLSEIDLPEMLPICVVAGDANDLKRINDTYGHAKGDLLLQNIASALSGCAPPDSFFARMGGDEFAGLLPRTDEAEGQAFLKRVESELKQQNDPELAGAGVALGMKIKYSPQEDLLRLMKDADLEMYKTKHNRRKQ